MRKLCLAALLCLGIASLPSLQGQPAAPPPPATYDVKIRYSINAFRNERVVLYFEMMKYLKEAGFVRDPNEDVAETEPEDATHTLISGSIPGDKLRLLLGQRHIRTVRAVPKGAKFPDDKDAPVRVHLELARHTTVPVERDLSAQVREVLGKLGFKEGVAYDNRDFTRLVGAIPQSQLDALLADLRTNPAAKDLAQKMPFSVTTPIRLVEVWPETPAPPVRPPAPVTPKGTEKLSPELRELLKDAAKVDQPTRLEVVLMQVPRDDERRWRVQLQDAAPDTVSEGRVGPLVTVLGTAKSALALSASPLVANIRLPRDGTQTWPAPGPADPAEFTAAMKVSGVAALHDKGFRGKGTRVAVIDSDFRGWQAAFGKDGPAPTVIDMTIERNRTLLPDADPPGAGIGSGTWLAQRVLAVAPEAELVLVRVDPAAPYMVNWVARVMNGEEYRSYALEDRLAELDAERFVLRRRKDDLLEERRIVLEDFGQDPAAVKRRDDYRQKQMQYDRDEQNHTTRIRRYFAYTSAVKELEKVDVACCPLVWPEGHAADGGSALTRYFDDRPLCNKLWFQAAGNTRGQAWAGLYRDNDGNGVMDFWPRETLLPREVWSRELNFLSWQAGRGEVAREVPEGATLRVTLQWREAHDESFSLPGEDRFRVPLNRFHLMLLRQLDPDGKALPADDLEVTTEAADLGQCLHCYPGGAVYEQVLELRVTKAGRYAVRIEGDLAKSTLPRDAVQIGAAPQNELRPRLFVQTLAGGGRALLDSTSTDEGSLGAPADARHVGTVGVADLDGKALPYSPRGPVWNVRLGAKPDLLAFDDRQRPGTASAAAFAAGTAAVTKSAGIKGPDWMKSLGLEPGAALRIRR